VPTDGSDVSAIGGDTACVEIRCDSQILLFDAGTGIRKAGLSLAKEGVRDFNIFLSHSHYDHVIGLPFFSPLFDSKVHCAIWSGHTQGKTTTRELIGGLLSPPFFPAGPDMFRARTTYCDFMAGDILDPGGGVRISTARLDHPGGVIGYRIEFDGHAIAYMTDTGTGAEEANAAALRLAERADMVIYDCMYTEEEALARAEFGHSTWKNGIEICRRAGAERLAMFHHAPERDDAGVLRLEEMAAKVFAGAFAAREGMKLSL
jgi:phosphoribosyl 1,2-cyclic phosphodiesterase